MNVADIELTVEPPGQSGTGAASRVDSTKAGAILRSSVSELQNLQVASVLVTASLDNYNWIPAGDCHVHTGMVVVMLGCNDSTIQQ